MQDSGGAMTGKDQPDRRAIVCGISADHGFALAALMVGVARHNPGFQGAYVVFHDGLDAAQQAKLRALWPKTQFQTFNVDTLARRFGPGVDIAPARAMYSPLVFAKFEMPDLLEAYDKCLWLDVDILVQGDFTDAWAFEALAWRPLPEGAFARRAEAMTAFAGLRRDGYPLLNGGVVGMGQGLRNHIEAPDLYAMAARIMAQVGAHGLDELALFFAACERGLPLHLLDQRFNHPVVAPGGRTAALVHAIGPDKFWNAAPLQLAYPEWGQHAAAWSGPGFAGPQRLGGPATPDSALKATRNQAFWLGVYEVLRPTLPPRLRPDLRSDGPSLRLFIANLPETTHLRLTRQKTDRKIGVELCFEADETLAPLLLSRIRAVKLPKGKPLDALRTKQGWSFGAIVPMPDCVAAIARIMEQLETVPAH